MGQSQTYFQQPATLGVTSQITVTAGTTTALIAATSNNPGVSTSNDGIPDWYKTQYGFDLTVNNAPYDADGVGISNLQHYLNSTNPMVNTFLAPYLTGFEVSDGFQPGALAGQNGWRDSAQGSSIETTNVGTGGQAVSVTGSSTASRRFYTLKSNVNLQAEIYLSSAASFTNSLLGLPTGVAAVLSYDPAQGLMALNGNGSNGGTWTVAPGTLANNQWSTVSLVESYANQTWSLQVNGKTVLSGLGFASSTATRFIDVDFQNGNAPQTYFDNVAITAQ